MIGTTLQGRSSPARERHAGEPVHCRQHPRCALQVGAARWRSLYQRRCRRVDQQGTMQHGSI